MPRTLFFGGIAAAVSLLEASFKVRDVLLDVDQHLLFILHYFRGRVRAATSVRRVVSNFKADDSLRILNVFCHISVTTIDLRSKV